QGEAQAKIEEAAAQVHLAEIAAFELGCDIAAHTSPTSVVHRPSRAPPRPPHGQQCISSTRRAEPEACREPPPSVWGLSSLSGRAVARAGPRVRPRAGEGQPRPPRRTRKSWSAALRP